MRNLVVVCLVLVCALSFPFVASSSSSVFEVYDDVTIVGVGTIDIDRMAQTSPSYSGQKYYETVLPSFPYDRSPSYYHSSLELILSNCSANTTLYHEVEADLASSKHRVENENFELGTCAFFYYKGPHAVNASFDSTAYLSEAIVKSEAEGRTIVGARVVNITDQHTRNWNSRTWLQGDYDLDWYFLVFKPEIPEADDDDWMPCP